MGTVFALFTAIIVAIDGHYRRALAGERDRLAHQLAANERLRAELEMHADALRRQNETLKRLEQTNRRHTQFMVHDFKGHLQVIMGFSSILGQRPAVLTDVQSVEAVERIERQAARMNGAVHDLLDFARLQESPHLRLGRTPPSALLQRAAADVTLPSHLGCVSIGGRHGDCPEVLVDARLIERVLVNLAANALKHNRRGTRVELDASLDLGSRAVVFSCVDDGQGFSVEAQASLFRVFETGAEPATDDSTGLGLAFCRAAAEAHGGRIWCESSEGAGARFYFTIPLGPGGREQWRAIYRGTYWSSTTSPTSSPSFNTF